MALTSARQILNKKILDGGSSADVQELKVEVAALSASVLTIGGKVENATEYSTDEQIVGKWVDESDVYERTYIFETPVSIGANTWVNIGVIIANLNLIIQTNIIETNGSNMACDATDSENGLLVRSSRSTGGEIKMITLKYTKTAAESKKRTIKKK